MLFNLKLTIFEANTHKNLPYLKFCSRFDYKFYITWIFPLKVEISAEFKTSLYSLNINYSYVSFESKYSCWCTHLHYEKHEPYIL